MSRDQTYGGLIFAAALAVAVIYVIVFFAPYLGFPASWSWWAVAVPMFLLVIAALAICMWIGWTMLTTPPPMPIESELKAESEPESEKEAKNPGEK
ncbi:MAG: phage holin family protein [Candidatus Bathyarchaeia archaeon]